MPSAVSSVLPSDDRLMRRSNTRGCLTSDSSFVDSSFVDSSFGVGLCTCGARSMIFGVSSNSELIFSVLGSMESSITGLVVYVISDYFFLNFILRVENLTL